MRGVSLRGMSLPTFLDIVWAEIWDDANPMSDTSQYHQIVKELFIEGKDPYDIWYEVPDKKGKKKRQRLSDTRLTSRRHDIEALRDLTAKAKEAAAAQKPQVE